MMGSVDQNKTTNYTNQHFVFTPGDNFIGSKSKREDWN